MLIDKGRAAEAVEILREAVGDGIDALASADDSDGAIGEQVAELLALHLRAARQARPDPAALAGYLAAHNLAESTSRIRPGGVRRTARRAGPGTGLRRVSRGLRTQSARRAGEAADGAADPGRGRRGRTGRAARPGPRLARLPAPADRPGARGGGPGPQALRWAETGLREATGFIGTDLVDFVALRYAQAGRMDDLLALRRDRFLAEMTVSHYELLREAAQRNGVWVDERERAMAVLREDLAKQGPKALYGMGPVLIDILIAEGDAGRGLGAGAEGVERAAAAQTRRADPRAPARGGARGLPHGAGPAARADRRGRLPPRARAAPRHQGLPRAARTAGRVRPRTCSSSGRDQRRKRNLIRLLDAAGLVPG